MQIHKMYLNLPAYIRHTCECDDILLLYEPFLYEGNFPIDKLCSNRKAENKQNIQYALEMYEMLKIVYHRKLLYL